MKRNPNKLTSYDKTYFAVLKWLSNKLKEEDSVTILVGITGKEAQREVFQFNSLRKSLEYYAPNHELTNAIKGIQFKIESDTLDISCDKFSVIAENYSKIPKDIKSRYDRLHKICYEEIEIPEVEKRPIEVKVDNPSQDNTPLEHPTTQASNQPFNDKYLDEIFK